MYVISYVILYLACKLINHKSVVGLILLISLCTVDKLASGLTETFDRPSDGVNPSC